MSDKIIERSVIGCVIIGILFIVYSVWVYFQDGERPIEQYIEQSHIQELGEKCKTNILDKLKAPGSAQFSNLRNIGERFIVYDVDAQNSFGALLRSSYLCDLESALEDYSLVVDVTGIKNIEELDENQMEICMIKYVMDESIKSCIEDTKRKILRQKSCDEARDLHEQGLISGESAETICNQV